MTGSWKIGTFRFDVTPPIGHSCCGGWIRPVEVIDDSLEAIGFVLLGPAEPIVVCAVDWLGLCDDAHLAWRKALAEAAGTVPERVAVQTVHQHNAPLVSFQGAELVAAQSDLPPVFDPDFFRACLGLGQTAVREALHRVRPVSHVAAGEARVDRVASNRRVARDAAGKVGEMRPTSCRNPALRALPEGPIDPMLKTVAFYDGRSKVAACHYYATHPMSFYGDGRVTSDFCGLARKRRQAEEPGCLHIYFNGCGGDIGAGKYNDGSPAARQALAARMHAAMAASELMLRPEPLAEVEWRTREITFPPHPAWVEEALWKELSTRTIGQGYRRAVAALKLAWLDRCRRGLPIVLSGLRLNSISVLHLPAEAFVAYQLRAQEMAPSRFVAVAAYGDDGPFYLPTRDEFSRGGYEASMAFASEAVDDILTEGMRRLLE